eukprot:m.299209 g.299209  ORF g.299209 m.299209 type:complete len:601 (+) comp20106_c0_seq1:365-2167(+)
MLKRIRSSFKGKRSGSESITDPRMRENGDQARNKSASGDRPIASGDGLQNTGELGMSEEARAAAAQLSQVRQAISSRAMGRRVSVSNFLPAPITTVAATEGKGNGLVWAEACMQGWRSHMEDAYIAEVDTLKSMPGWSLFAILDGHAGEVTAKHTAATLAATCEQWVAPVRHTPRGCMDGMRRAFLAHDRLLDQDFTVLRDQSGTTCTCLLVGPQELVLVNIGDSRTMLARSGKVIVATVDHKPTDSKEVARIHAAGGRVFNGRVDGGLALSRAFGDFEYKMRSDLPQTRQKVTAEPDSIFVHRIYGADEYALLACDGLWDIIDCTRVDKIVRTGLHKKATPKAICEQLVRLALERGSRDNISVMLVLLPKQQPPQFAQHTATTPEQLAVNVGQSLVSHMMRMGVEIGARMLHVARLREQEAQAKARARRLALFRQRQGSQRHAPRQGGGAQSSVTPASFRSRAVTGPSRVGAAPRKTEGVAEQGRPVSRAATTGGGAESGGGTASTNGHVTKVASAKGEHEGEARPPSDMATSGSHNDTAAQGTVGRGNESSHDHGVPARGDRGNNTAADKTPGSETGSAPPSPDSNTTDKSISHVTLL